MTEIVVKIIIALLIFALYLELSPGLSNIWYRVNSDGIKTVTWKNLLVFVLDPFYRPTLWHWQLLDTNSIIFVSCVVGIWYLFDDLHVTKSMPLVESQNLNK